MSARNKQPSQSPFEVQFGAINWILANETLNKGNKNVAKKAWKTW